MSKRVMAASLSALAISLCVAAKAEDAPAPPQPSPTQPTSEATPAPPSRARVFLVQPEDSQQIFMCETGRVQSVLATAIAEHRPVSISLLALDKSAIPDGVWTSAYGFRFAHKQNVIVSVVMICGN